MTSAILKYPSVFIGQLFPNPPGEDGQLHIVFRGNLEYAVSIEVRRKNGQIMHASAHGLAGS